MTLMSAGAAQAHTAVSDPYLDPSLAESHWLVSRFVGSNFGSDADEASTDFGGSIGYLWNGAFGGESVSSFSPDFQLAAACANQTSRSAWPGDCRRIRRVGA